jgi:hypothetical protein
MFDEKLPVMRRHLPVVLPGNGVCRVISLLLERLRFLPKYCSCGHGVLPRAFSRTSLIHGCSSPAVPSQINFPYGRLPQFCQAVTRPEFGFRLHPSERVRNYVRNCLGSVSFAAAINCYCQSVTRPHSTNSADRRRPVTDTFNATFAVSKRNRRARARASHPKHKDRPKAAFV